MCSPDLRFSIAEVCKRFFELVNSKKRDPDDMEPFSSFKTMSSGTEASGARSDSSPGCWRPSMGFSGTR